MAKTRALVQRRRAIRNIRKITRTMELIATARFKKALDRAVEAEAYTRKIAELAADLSASATNVTHPLLTEHEEVKNTLLLVLTSRGRRSNSVSEWDQIPLDPPRVGMWMESRLPMVPAQLSRMFLPGFWLIRATMS